MLPIHEPDGIFANELLSDISAAECERLSPNLILVDFSLGDVIYELDGNDPFIYFPTTCVVSLVHNMENGSSVATALAGKDGVIDTSSFLGGVKLADRAIVTIAGQAYRMDRSVLRAEFARGGLFQHVLLRYVQLLISQISKTAACNRLHCLEKRLCRWLLLTHDRARSNTFTMTQDFISHMLGGRRETVTVAAARLQDAGLIHYTRGQITIVDRMGLEATACECYQMATNRCEELATSRLRPRLVYNM